MLVAFSFILFVCFFHIHGFPQISADYYLPFLFVRSTEKVILSFLCVDKVCFYEASLQVDKRET